MKRFHILLIGMALVSSLMPCVAADLPKFLAKGKTYKLTFTVPLSISREEAPPPSPFPLHDEALPKPQKIWLVEVLDIDPSGWILCDTPSALTGIPAGSNPLLPPIWISLGALATIQPMEFTGRPGVERRRKPEK